MADEILVATHEHVCTITLNRPDKRNALTKGMCETLVQSFRRLSGDPSVRVIVMRGAGPSFCAGLDLREMAAQRATGEAELGPLEQALETLDHCPQPTIAAVQGDAIAGGCELALHCDLRVAADSARFSMPLARIGLAVPVSLTWKLVDMIGMAKTKEMLFTGDAVGAEEALRLGLANRVVPAAELDRAVRTLAHQITQNAPLAVRAMKAFVQRAVGHRRELVRGDLEDLARQVRASRDLQEGLAAQRERRVPTFRGE
jgi:enoyl-CoA hydratase/carnithine racemase